MNKGTVKWFSNQKGYGFILTKLETNVFVHYSGLNMEGFKTLEEGQAVEFEVTEGAKRTSGNQCRKTFNQNLYCAFYLYILISIFHN